MNKLLLSFTLIVTFYWIAPSQTIFYVDADSEYVYDDIYDEIHDFCNNGNSWDTAFTDLEIALELAWCYGSQIQVWVAEGTYYGLFWVDADDIHLYGGFSGNENSLEDRDINANPTILSGDVGVLNDHTDNRRVIELGCDNCTLDGFTIRDGLTSLAFGRYGGGINVRSGRIIKVRNNTIENNTSIFDGGGVYFDHPDHIEFTNNILKNNIATTGNGGGIHFTAGIESMEFTNNILENNIATTGNGGGFYLKEGPHDYFLHIFRENTIINNTAPNGHGGGGYIADSESGELKFDNNTFESNEAINGGGIAFDYPFNDSFYYLEGVLELKGNTFDNNIAIESGGGFYFKATGEVESETNFKIINNTFKGNSAETNGGGFYFYYSDFYNEGPDSDFPFVFNNNEISNNTAGENGGGSFINIDRCNAVQYGDACYTTFKRLINNKIYNNSAKGGGGLYLKGTNYNLSKSSIYENSAEERGGGVYIANSAVLESQVGEDVVSENRIYNNSATLGGGVYFINAGDPFNNLVFFNNLLYSNTASDKGGGLFLNSWALNTNDNSLTNNTFYDNKATADGGGVYFEEHVHAEFIDIIIRNSIFWNNQKDGDVSIAGADINDTGYNALENSLTQENSYYSTGNGIINNQDPLFVDTSNPVGEDGLFGTVDDGFMLKNNSPAIDSGSNEALIEIMSTDITCFNHRIQNEIVDMGAYESSCPLSSEFTIATTDTQVQKSFAPPLTHFNSDCNTQMATITSEQEMGVVNAKVWIEDEIPVQQTTQFPYLNRHYELEPLSPFEGIVRIKLYFTQEEFDLYNAHENTTLMLPQNADDEVGISALRITKKSGSSSDNTGLLETYGSSEIIDPDDSDVVWNAEKGWWEVSFDISEFSGFFIHTSDFILPIKLIDFKANLHDLNNVLLSWKTASEIDSDYFIVEHSQNGLDFEAIGRVYANGNSSSEKNYSLIHHYPKTINYYRLKQVDEDGEFEYSPTILLQLDQRKLMPAYPNPTNGILYLTNDIGDKQSIKLFSSSGILVFESESQNQVDISHLAKGLYLLQISYNGQIITHKIIKN